MTALLQLLALVRSLTPEPFDAGPCCIYEGSTVFYYRSVAIQQI